MGMQNSVGHCTFHDICSSQTGLTIGKISLVLLLFGQWQAQQACCSNIKRNERLCEHDPLLTFGKVALFGPRQAVQQRKTIHCEVGKLGTLAGAAVKFMVSAWLELHGFQCA